MTSVAESVSALVSNCTVQEDEPISASADAERAAAPETQQEVPEDASTDVTPTLLSSADVQVHEPYQVDFITPRQVLFANQALQVNGGTYAAKDGMANNRNSSSTASPSPKVKGRPSQAPLHAARVARTAERVNHSTSPEPLQRSHRRPQSAASTVTPNGTAGATVLSTSTRRVLPTGETSKAAAAAATTTTTTAVTTTRTSNNGSTNILLRHPRFVDPMATVAPSNHATATATLQAKPAQYTKSVRPVGMTALASTASPASSATAPANHAALHNHPILHNSSAHAPQRMPVSADSANSDAHHRRRLLNNAHSVKSAIRGGVRGNANAAPQELTRADDSTAAVPSTQDEFDSPLSPLSPDVGAMIAKIESEKVGSDVTVDVHEISDDAAETTQTTQTPDAETVAESSNTTVTTTSMAAKPTPHSTALTHEPHVKVVSSAVALQPAKRVILSRPTSSQYPPRMSDLTRPSEAYKVPLNSSLQSSALARRSRQPRKVLNVFLTKYPVLRKLADELGWVMETTEEELDEYKFNMCWSDTVLSLMRLVRLSNWQRTNHFPSMYLLCRKGHLGTTLGKLRHKLPSHFAFYPRTWSMRSERLQFAHYLAAVRQRRLLKYFIMKPNSGCQGRGIIVSRDPLTALDEHTLDNYIVQEYVHRPLLLEGKKFDLRVYVLLTSIRHPSIFLFNDGLVRICTEEYETPTEENVKNACKHLTNYAVNKKSSDYVFNTDVEHMDVGNKRNFAFLNRWLEESGRSSAELWDQVGVIVVKTILAAQSSIARVYDSCFPTGYNDGYCCFEVLGFDILIDHKMKPWLMEVNHTPSFATETPLDMDIKSRLLTEVWSIIDCKATDYEKDRQREREEFTKRNMPPWASKHPLYSSQPNQTNGRNGFADDVDSPPNVGSPILGSHNDPLEVPAYVHTRRQHEDSKLCNFKRIYPSENAEMQLIYDTIQNLALAESANNRLYYNSTVAAPVPSQTSAYAASTAPLGMRSNNPLPLRARPPSLGPVLTTSRVYSGISSPNAAVSQRSLASPATPPPSTTVLAPPNGAPHTIPVSSVPSLTITRDSHQKQSATGGLSAASSHPTPSIVSRGEPSSSNVSTSRNSVTPSEINTNTITAGSPVPPLSAAFLTGVEADAGRRDGSRTSSGTTPKVPTPAAGEKPLQAVRVFTPRVSSPMGSSRNTIVAPTPHAAAETARNYISSGATTPAAAAKSASEGSVVKPRVAEVRLRAASRPSIASLNASVLHEVAPEEHLSQTPAPTPAAETATTPTSISLPPHRGAPPVPTTNVLRHTYHQNGSVVTPPAGAETQKSHASGPTIRITSISVGRQRPPSMDMPSTNRRDSSNSNQQQLSSSTPRRSLSLSGSERDMDDGAAGVAALPRKKSVDHESRFMSTHPEPTEEELARLVALQAQLDYEAAADPPPDDEGDDFNLTE